MASIGTGWVLEWLKQKHMGKYDCEDRQGWMGLGMVKAEAHQASILNYNIRWVLKWGA